MHGKSHLLQPPLFNNATNMRTIIYLKSEIYILHEYILKESLYKSNIIYHKPHLQNYL